MLTIDTNGNVFASSQYGFYRSGYLHDADAEELRAILDSGLEIQVQGGSSNISPDQVRLVTDNGRNLGTFWTSSNPMHPVPDEDEGDGEDAYYAALAARRLASHKAYSDYLDEKMKAEIDPTC